MQGEILKGPFEVSTFHQQTVFGNPSIGEFIRVGAVKQNNGIPWGPAAESRACAYDSRKSPEVVSSIRLQEQMSSGDFASQSFARQNHCVPVAGAFQPLLFGFVPAGTRQTVLSRRRVRRVWPTSPQLHITHV